MNNDDLQHHGILGMKWGVRRYQDYDGSLTPAGMQRYLPNRGFGRAWKAIKNALWNTSASGSAVSSAFRNAASSNFMQSYAKRKVSNITSGAAVNPASPVLQSVTGLAGVMQRRAPGSIRRSIEGMLIENDLNAGKLSRESATLLRAANGMVDKFLYNHTMNLSGALNFTSYDVNSARQSAEYWCNSLMKQFGNVPVSYLNDTTISFMRSMGHSGLDDALKHHGILGMRWGIRRYQNYDGTLTNAGRRRLERKDNRWAKRNYNKIYKNVFKNSRKEVKQLIKGLNEQVESKLKSGKVSYKFVNAYNKGLAAIMNKNMQEIYSPSGKVIRWVAKRGELGVYMALADPGYDMNQVRNGVYGSGRIAYRKDTVGTA